MLVLRFALPYPPFGVNHMYAHSVFGPGGIRVPAKGKTLKAKARHWQDDVVKLLRQDGPLPRIHGRVALSLWIHPPDRKKRDIDGVVKLVQDSIALAFQFDDSQVKESHQYWLDVVCGGCVEVEIRAAE